MPKYGDINPENNLVFVQRGPTYPNGEYWVSRDAFEKRKESVKKRQKFKRETDKSFAQSLKEKQRLRGQRPDVKKKRVERHKLNMETNPVYAIKFLTRMRLAALKKRNGTNKSMSSRRMLGADPYICKKFLEDQFVDGMDWQNRGDWHIDHFFPISLAKNKTDVRVFSHFTNLRPLWASENMIKHNTPPSPLEMIMRDQWVEEWIKTNFQLQQMQNAEIGRIGTAPAQMGGVQTQQMQQG
jgi:hypothetical protein